VHPGHEMLTHYTEVVFLHSVRSTGHVVHSGACGGAKCCRTIFHAHVSLMRFPYKARQDITQNMCFESYGIYGSHSCWC
jgi:hypothetical protein